MTLIAVFGGLVALMVLGLPVASALGATSVITFLLLGEGRNMAMLAQRMYSATTGFTLLAIPFFILAGNLMNQGGITRRIFAFATALVGHIWGGLGQVNVVSSMIFSGMSGAAVADAAGLGSIELKAMTDNGYDRNFSAAITCASSTIGPVVPPSIPFVIYGSITGVSVGQLFLAGFTPGALMGIAMMIAVYIVSKRRNYPREQRAPLSLVGKTFVQAALPMGTPVIIIGGILLGWFTPTEAAVVACIYAIVVGMVVYHELRLKDLPGIFMNSIYQSVKVLFIIAAAGFFGWLLIHQQIPQLALRMILGVSSNPAIVLSIVMLFLIILGCFIEGVAVLVVTTPILLPVIQAIDMNLVQFGVVMILTSMIGLVTPPVGMSLYAVSSISNVKIGVLSRELLPYLLGIFLVLLVVAFVPLVSTWLPQLVFGN